MDDMYKTVQVACRMAKQAHNKEKRVHVIFKEVGLFRVKPVDEIREIDQQAIFGWTVPSWIPSLHQDLSWDEERKQFPMGDDCFVRKQFYKMDCYFNPADAGMKLYNEYTQEERYRCLRYGQRL